MTSNYTWQAMLDDFRRLGGIADNIEQRVGEHGNGIFPIDPDQPIHIEIPRPLLIDTSQIRLEGGDLVIAPEAQVPAEVRAFFTAYQKHFSWGAEGRKNAESFEAGLKTLPEALLDKMKEMQLINLETRHVGDWDEIVMQRFLRSRRINYHKQMVSMPIIELINHSPLSQGYTIRETIKVAGKFDGEVTVNYNPFCDSLIRFLNYGFANQERVAYSLPLTMKTGNRQIRIECDAANHEKVDGMLLPKVEVLKNNARKLTHLKLGMEGTPRVPKTLFRKILDDAAPAVADELFERIRAFNQFELCNMLVLLDGIDDPLANEFRRALIFQLRAHSHCFGVRADQLKPAEA